jgi:hypothetical protein
MPEAPTLAITTQLFGLGTPRSTPPVYVTLSTHTTTARDLIAGHVQAEIERTRQTRQGSLALHYLLGNNLRASAEPDLGELDVGAETERACRGLAERRYLLVVDGATITDLDAPLALNDRSVVAFVRLLPLIGG